MDTGFREFLILLLSYPDEPIEPWLDSQEGREWLVSEEGREQLEALNTQISVTLGEMHTRESAVIKARFGFEGTPQLRRERIVADFGVTNERVRQIESKFISKIRHPSRSTLLRDYLEGGEWTPDLERELGFPQPQEVNPVEEDKPRDRP